MYIQIDLHRRVVSNTRIVAHDLSARLLISEAYGGTHYANEVKNFLFDIGNTSLLQTWITRQGRRIIRKLEHTTCLQDYVKAFTALMLDIRDMSEKDKLLTFMEGLKPWISTLRTRGKGRWRLTLHKISWEEQNHSRVTATKVWEIGNPRHKEVRMEVRIGTNLTRTNRGHNKRAADASCATACIDMLNALAIFIDKASLAKPVEPRAPASGENESKIHGKLIRATIDTGATHNYLASAEVERYGLVLEKEVGRVKVINLAAQPIIGVAKFVLIKIGPFEGKTNLSVMVMDDFKLILGLEFLRDTRTTLLPHVDPMMMLGPSPVSSSRWASYKMSEPELMDLKKQVKDRLESSIIKLATLSYGA
ncbi:UNVERIFIED_CONTAM: hypothetical protein Scaly_1169500 [Sesamum calycinum]|uniref:Uncharacterized protein n=1 Tax=Sesamum calycinum TaxID=2727403 RepID=A0AAW2Q314_9LAMI